MAETRYTDEEVDAILERALARDASASGLTHDELRAAAEEVGISREAFESAALEVRKPEARVVEVKPQRSRFLGWLRHFVTYAVVIAFLFAINLASGGSYPWWMWPALGWGLGVALHLVAVIFPRDPGRAAARRARKERRRERRRARRHGAEFQRNVDKAVDALVRAIEKRAKKSASPPRKLRAATDPVDDENDEDETVPEKKKRRIDN